MPLHHRELGTGDPIVLLHPGPGLDGSVFLPGVERLAAAGHRVILADLPGSGRSAEAGWTVAEQAAAVQAFVEEELHWSAGRCTGTRSAATSPASTSSTTPGTAARLIAACTDCDEEEPVDVDPFEGLPEDVAARVKAAFDAEHHVQRPRSAARCGLTSSRCSPTRTSRTCSTTSSFAPRPTSTSWASCTRSPALAQAEIPVLAVGGLDDRVDPPPFARRIAETAKHGELLLVPGGHFPFAEDPVGYWDAIAGWLSRTR